MTRDALLPRSIKFLAAFRRNLTTNWFTKLHSRTDRKKKSRKSLHWIQISSPSTGEDRVAGGPKQKSTPPLPPPRRGKIEWRVPQIRYHPYLTFPVKGKG